MARRFWKQHTRYLVRRDELQDREDAMRTRLAYGRRELEKLQRTNVYSASVVASPSPGVALCKLLALAGSRRGPLRLLPDDAFCIGQEAGFGTINGLRLGRLPGVNVRPPTLRFFLWSLTRVTGSSDLPSLSLSLSPTWPLCVACDVTYARQVEWPEINAAWGHTVLLLSTIATKFGFHRFRGYRLVPCGSFSTIEKLGGAGASDGGGGGGGDEDSPARGGAAREPAGPVAGGRGVSGANVRTTSAVGGGGGGGDFGGDAPGISAEGKAVVAVYELLSPGACSPLSLSLPRASLNFLRTPKRPAHVVLTEHPSPLHSHPLLLTPSDPVRSSCHSPRLAGTARGISP